MRCLALDCSSVVGFALFERPGDKAPSLGSWPLPGTFGSVNGRRFVAFEDFLADFITVTRPDLVAFEAPILPFARDLTNSSGDVVRLLVGLATIVELVAERAKCRCVEVAVPTVKVKLAGRRFAAKTEMIVGAHRLGFVVEDDHQADAIGVALCAYEHVGLEEVRA